MQNAITYEQAKRHVERKIGLMTHAAVFVAVNTGLMLLNMQPGSLPLVSLSVVWLGHRLGLPCAVGYLTCTRKRLETTYDST